jgi:hypothetical protein
MRTEFGKIESATFGHGGYQDACIGIHITLAGKSWGVSTGLSAWDACLIKHDDRCKWSEADRSRQYDEIVRYISKLLSEANVGSIDKLKGVPVEATFDGMTLKTWRVLSEVL